MSSTPQSQQMQHATFVMLGDSLLAGYDWQQRMPNFYIRNFGMPGATTGQLLQALPRMKKHQPNADLILVMVGTNDVAMENFSFSPELRQIIVALSRDYPAAELLVNNLLPMKLPHLGNTAIDRVNDSIKAICNETGSCYVDACSRFRHVGGALFQQDGVHLTNEGYALWARTILEHIAFLFEND